VLSEPLYAPLVALILLGAYRLRDEPTTRNGALLGLAIGLAALTRPEALMFVPLLLLLFFRQPRAVGAVCVVTALVVAPWVIRNWSAFDRPLMSNQSAETIAGANCPTTYHGVGIGFWDVRCLQPPGRITDNEAERAARWKTTGIDYAKDHIGRVPVVVAARVGRVVGLFKPGQQVQIDAFLGPYGVGLTRTALHGFQAVALLAVAGAVLLRRRRTAPVFPLLAPPVVVLVTVVVTYGLTRFRFAAMPALIVLAAVAIDAVIARIRRERASVTPGEGAGQPRAALRSL
jgi:4-amino-4-deoxy-L-arabinose transferase-like glycosyltransferase